ncbi:hypothetical protein [Pusillimonas sp.]|uniref:hypothetical protein n=1 Tax=Pusillimonas sp. TaxID=3040095 RepID=UPI0037CB1612
MSLIWSFAPVFMLASVLLALARRSGSPAPWACGVFAALFFLLGVLGLSAEISQASALGTGVLFILVGLPLASSGVALWCRLAPRIGNSLNFS